MAHSNPCGVRPRNANHSTLIPAPTSIPEAVAQLRTAWFFLSHFERAKAVRDIVRAGLSRRFLAKSLHTSEGSIRNLLAVLEADPADQEAFRRNEIGLNEVLRRGRGLPPRDHVRRAEISSVPEPTPDSPAPEYPQEREPFDLTETIVGWFAANPARSSSARMILEETLRMLNRAARAGNLPLDRPPAGMAIAEVIRRCQPGPRGYDLDIAFYADWAFNWVTRLANDANHGREALNQALARVKAGSNRPELW